MTDEPIDSRLSRRNYVQLFGGVAGAASLAGCLSGEGDGEGDGDDGYNTLEIQHWWTDGGDAVAMDALVEGFKEEHPDIEVGENPVSGGGGTNLQAVIRERVLSGDPPSTWQDWPGANLADYVEADTLKDIGYIFDGDMEDNYLEGALLSARAGDPDNPYVAVPLNIHRINNLFYDVAAVEDAGVDPASIGDPEELNEALAQIEDQTDLAGLAVQQGSPWSTLQLWGNVLMGMFGPETYSDFRNGEDVEDEVRQSLAVTDEMIDHLTADAGSLTNDAAGNKLPGDQAAFAQEGDWLAGNYQATEDYDFEADWDHVPFPGTEGAYQINTDGFPYPKPNPSPDATDAWMEYVGSAKAHRIFNPKKGSIPCRGDVDVSEFPDFLQRQYDDFTGSDVQPLTIAHGDGVRPNQDVALKNAMSRFIDNRNVDATTEALLTAIST